MIKDLEECLIILDSCFSTILLLSKVSNIRPIQKELLADIFDIKIYLEDKKKLLESIE